MKLQLSKLRFLIQEAIHIVVEGQYSQFKDTIKNLPKDGSVFFHMSTLNKVGLNPKVDYKTPLSICTYPLTDETANLLLTANMPFANKRPFVHFISPKNPSKILQFQNMTVDHAQKIWNDISAVTNQPADLLKKKFSQEKLPAQTLWDTCQNIWGEKPVQWTSALVKAGIEGIVDMGDGIFNENEPFLGAFFNAKFINNIVTVNNVWRPGDEMKTIQAVNNAFLKFYVGFMDAAKAANGPEANQGQKLIRKLYHDLSQNNIAAETAPLEMGWTGLQLGPNSSISDITAVMQDFVHIRRNNDKFAAQKLLEKTLKNHPLFHTRGW